MSRLRPIVLPWNRTCCRGAGASTVTGVMLGGEDLVEGVDYLTQTGMQDESSAWLYLARPLDVGETITVTTMP